MKTNHIYKSWTLAVAVLTLALLPSCSNDDITLKSSNSSAYTVAKGDTPAAYSVGGSVQTTEEEPLEIVNTATTSLGVSLTRPATEDVVITATIKPELLESYNTEHKTSFALFPSSLVALSAEGQIQVAKGATKSSELSLTLQQNESLTEGTTFVLPIELSVKSGALTLSREQSQQFVFIRNFTKTKDASKSTGVKLFSCIEVNDTNPLNNLSFTLAGSGKPLVDAVILFSSNVNYDQKTGRVYIYHNENVKALLNNREKYLKPLQDKGIKVILSVMGNHDRSGIDNLTEATAKLFAQEIKTTCDAYHLDGVFYDDEYSEYMDLDGVIYKEEESKSMNSATAGFTVPSSASASRLIYEVWKLQPERWNITYVYHDLASLSEVDGVAPGRYVTYALHDYGQSADLSSSYPGLSVDRMGLYSQEFGRNNFASRYQLRRLKDRGSKAHMIFNLNPYRGNFLEGENGNPSQLDALRRIAETLFGDRLVDSGVRYKKDWK